MALYGIIGDIHGNREALIATLATLENYHPEQLVCVGDIIGYNADSDDCAAILRDRGALSVAGNHDLIGTGRLGFDRCSNQARHSLKLTRRRLQRDTAEYLRSLPRTLLIEDCVLLVHGGVRDVQQYMTQSQHIAENVRYLRADFPDRHICFYGHVHEQRIFEVEKDGRVRDVLAKGILKLRSDREYFINPGSLDASRKRAPKFAEFALFDSGPMTVEFFRVPYDDLLTESKATGAGYRIGPWRNRLYTLTRKIPGLR